MNSIHNLETLMSETPSKSRAPYGGPAITKFIHKPRWRPRDAAEIRQCMGKYFASPLGDLHLVSMHRAMQARRGIGVQAAHDARESIQPLKRELSRGWLRTGDDRTTILAGNDFAQMAIAAAASSPNIPLRSSEIISASGVLVFAEKQDFTPLVEPLAVSLAPAARPKLIRMFRHLPVRAVSWFPFAPDAADQPQALHVAVYTDGPDLQKYDEVLFPIPDQPYFLPGIAYGYLSTIVQGFGHLDGTQAEFDTVSSSVKVLMGFVRAVTALAQSPQVKNEVATDHGLKPGKKQGRRKQPVHDTQVRVLSLRHPEHGTYELDAATGRRIRAHWVRGHWKNQWYPASQEHRTIWIDGYVKGDVKLDVITGPKVYVA